MVDLSNMHFEVRQLLMCRTLAALFQALVRPSKGVAAKLGAVTNRNQNLCELEPLMASRHKSLQMRYIDK
jgi:hypothetical protein